MQSFFGNNVLGSVSSCRRDGPRRPGPPVQEETSWVSRTGHRGGGVSPSVSLHSAGLITGLWRATSLASPCPRLSARHPPGDHLVTPLAVAALAVVEMADSHSHRPSRSLTASFHVCLSGQLSAL